MLNMTKQVGKRNVEAYKFNEVKEDCVFGKVYDICLDSRGQ